MGAFGGLGGESSGSVIGNGRIDNDSMDRNRNRSRNPDQSQSQPQSQSINPPSTSTSTAPSSSDGRHWHIGEDEDGNEIEYQVYPHEEGEEGIPVMDDITGLPNVRMHVRDNRGDGGGGGGVGGGGGGGGGGGQPLRGTSDGGLANDTLGFDQQMSMEDMISSLMQALTGTNGGFGDLRLGGGGGQLPGNAGDYVFTQGEFWGWEERGKF